MTNDRHASLDAAAVILRDLTDEFRQEEEDTYPTLEELLEIIGLSVPTSDSLAELLIPIRFQASIDGRPYNAKRESRVGGLNDAVFVTAAALLTVIGDDIIRAGSSVSTETICEYLLVVIKQAGILLDDVRSADISYLGAAGPKRGVRAKIGDVVAIPSSKGNYYFASILIKNREGTGLGLWREKRRVPVLDASLTPSASRIVFTDEVAIRNGTWPVVGHSDVARALFPDDPETYFFPGEQYPGAPRIGEFGSAEQSDGTLRDVSREEAERVGLLDGSYKQSYISDCLPDVLDEERGN